MAEVNALLLASSTINQPISVVISDYPGLPEEHAYVVIGDSRETKNLIYSDAWPLYGRADTRGNTYLPERYEVVKNYPPNYANRSIQKNLINRNEDASMEEINARYKAEIDKSGLITDEVQIDPLTHITRQMGEMDVIVHQTYQSSKNINVIYRHGEDDVKHEISSSLDHSRDARYQAVTREERKKFNYNFWKDHERVNKENS